MVIIRCYIHNQSCSDGKMYRSLLGAYMCCIYTTLNNHLLGRIILVIVVILLPSLHTLYFKSTPHAYFVLHNLSKHFSRECKMSKEGN